MKIEQKKHTPFELIENENGDLGIKTVIAEFTLEKEFRATVANVIDPERQKTIDHQNNTIIALSNIALTKINEINKARELIEMAEQYHQGGHSEIGHALRSYLQENKINS